MITCCIQYTLDPHQLTAFEDYARRWPPIIERCGGDLVSYYMTKEGANSFAMALLDFDSLAAYEEYRAKLATDHEAQQNVADVQRSRAILVEARSFLRKV